MKGWLRFDGWVEGEEDEDEGEDEEYIGTIECTYLWLG